MGMSWVFHVAALPKRQLGSGDSMKSGEREGDQAKAQTGPAVREQWRQRGKKIIKTNKQIKKKPSEMYEYLL